MHIRAFVWSSTSSGFCIFRFHIRTIAVLPPIWQVSILLSDLSMRKLYCVFMFELNRNRSVIYFCWIFKLKLSLEYKYFHIFLWQIIYMSSQKQMKIKLAKKTIWSFEIKQNIFFWNKRYFYLHFLIPKFTFSHLLYIMCTTFNRFPTIYWFCGHKNFHLLIGIFFLLNY